MAYPVLPMSVASKRVPRDGREEDFAVSGGARIRDFYGADKYDFEIQHKSLTATQMAALEAHYVANRTATFDFVWTHTGATYTGMRYGKGGLRDSPSTTVPLCTDVTVRLVAS